MPATKALKLDQVKVRDILPKRRRTVVSLDHNTTVEAALSTLAAEHILSAPVVLAPSIEDSDEGTYLGIVDVLDVVTYIARQISPNLDKRAEAGERLLALRAAGANFMQKKLIQICGQDTGFAFRGALDQSVLRLVENGFVGSHGLPAHRVAICDARGDITHVVTQSDVVRYLANHPASLGRLADLTVEFVGWLATPQDPVVTAPELTPAIDVVRLMSTEGVSCVGLVGDGGRLVGNFSASDLKGLTADTFGDLARPAKEFTPSRRIKCVTPESTVLEAVRALADHKVHRVYVVDTKGLPVGIVTLTDVLAAVAARGGA